MIIKKLICCSIVVLSVGINGIVFADDNQTQDSNSSLALGIDGLYQPAFIGAKDYYLFALPDFDLNYKNTFFLDDEGARYALIKRAGWSLGPVAEVALPRNENGNAMFHVAGPTTHALEGLGNVDTTLNIGGFAAYNWRFVQAKMDLMQGIGGAVGVLSDIKVNYVNHIGFLYYMIGPKALVGNSKYTNSYWGIDNQQAANSGLASYHADMGVVYYGISAVGSIPLSKNMIVESLVEYDRLGVVAANSPLVQQRGNVNQWIADLSWDYYFKFY